MIKKYRDKKVLDAAKDRIRETFDNFERFYIAFSGGKDSTVTVHLVMDEAIKRGIKVGIMYIDFEAQYQETIKNVRKIFKMYNFLRDNLIELNKRIKDAKENFFKSEQLWNGI